MFTVSLPSEGAGGWDAGGKGCGAALISGCDNPHHAGQGEQVVEG